ncbi:hypothetical protein [Halalkalicoccus jeotgali]|uniref:DUF8097 domain-containing protein n=1 Tax=Halalkalicoccus jeotgali (strain DSM 18796 / CECT 7217 / JCM 14584 / KCTC 4019 / B3) TaxID=795797 RepID=D8J2Z7_HALJB|nr:hypothetical protein [Halalkalicoccus jeotgali]ADJ15104.1 hypothetical protein HacjB3_08605 [Halalkalicoccus jeotgali B3]ELY34876.1 hypothetical protein C497_14092 [Halalkalicoccus jeotgali B3]
MRTEAKILVFDIGVSLLGILSIAFSWWIQRQHDGASEWGPFSFREAILGATSSIAVSYVSDHDWWGVRRSRKRRTLLSLGWNVLFQKHTSESDWSFGLGSVLGSLSYRIWFGIVRPIPEPRLTYRGFLRRRS